MTNEERWFVLSEADLMALLQRARLAPAENPQKIVDSFWLKMENSDQGDKSGQSN